MLIAAAAKTSPASDAFTEMMKHMDAAVTQWDHVLHAKSRSSGQMAPVPAVSRLLPMSKHLSLTKQASQNPYARRRSLADKENQQPALAPKTIAF